MNAILTRTADMPVIEAPQQRARGAKGVLGFLSEMVQAAAKRLVSPHGDLPSEWFRFPLP